MIGQLLTRSMLSICLCLVALAASSCDSKQRGEDQTPASSDDAPAEKSAAADEAEELEAPELSDLEKFTEDIDGEGTLYAVIKTSEGDIRCDLHEERAPRTVANFVGLALGKKAWRNPETGDIERGTPYYNSIPFHRVIPNFMIQAGIRGKNGAQGPGYTIPDEFHPELRHNRAGVLSMANRGEPNSSGAQWFILEMPAPHLDDRHSVFGQCEGLDVVSKLARVPTGPENRPRNPPIIETIEIKRSQADSAPNTDEDASE